MRDSAAPGACIAGVPLGMECQKESVSFEWRLVASSGTLRVPWVVAAMFEKTSL
jgi:hypothetical protein